MQESPDESPYHAPKARLAEPHPDGSHPASHGQEATWGRTLAIWWSLSWRMGLLSGGAAILSISILQFVIGLVLAVLVGFSLALFISILVTRYVFDKDFENFYLRLFPEEPSVTFSRATSIWWCFGWRSSVAGFLISLLGDALGLLIGFTEQALLYSAVVQSIVSLPISVVVFRTVLRKRYRKFVIDIVPTRWAGDKRRVSPTTGNGRIASR